MCCSDDEKFPKSCFGNFDFGCRRLNGDVAITHVRNSRPKFGWKLLDQFHPNVAEEQLLIAGCAPGMKSDMQYFLVFAAFLPFTGTYAAYVRQSIVCNKHEFQYNNDFLQNYTHFLQHGVCILYV